MPSSDASLRDALNAGTRFLVSEPRPPGIEPSPRALRLGTVTTGLQLDTRQRRLGGGLCWVVLPADNADTDLVRDADCGVEKCM